MKACTSRTGRIDCHSMGSINPKRATGCTSSIAVITPRIAHWQFRSDFMHAKPGSRHTLSHFHLDIHVNHAGTSVCLLAPHHRPDAGQVGTGVSWVRQDEVRRGGMCGGWRAKPHRLFHHKRMYERRTDGRMASVAHSKYRGSQDGGNQRGWAGSSAGGGSGSWATARASEPSNRPGCVWSMTWSCPEKAFRGVRPRRRRAGRKGASEGGRHSVPAGHISCSSCLLAALPTASMQRR